MKRISSVIIVFFVILNLKAQSVDETHNKGFFNITQAGFINVKEAREEIFSPDFGTKAEKLSVDKAIAYSLQTINGFFISPNLSLGVGIGLDGYQNPDINTAPLYVDLRTYLLKGKNSPFLVIDYGWLLKFGNEFKKGNMVKIGVGWKFPISKKICMIADVSFMAKGISLTNDSYTESRHIVDVKGSGVNFGFIF